MELDGKLQIICDALVACLEEVPRESYAQATPIIQQVILQLLHKLSGGKVTKIFLDYVDENSVAVRQVAEPEGKKDTSVTSVTTAVAESGSKNNEAEIDSSELCTATEVPEEEAKEIELQEENPQVLSSTSKNVVSILKPDVKLKKQALMKVSSEEAKQLLQAKCQRVIHEDGSHVFVCSVCKRPFKEKAKLKRHLLIHAGIKPFTCDICFKNFTQKTHLKDHLNTHTGDRKNKCPDCGRKFSFARNLRRHQKLHTNERAHCCDECPARFVSSDKLYLHSLQHSGHKPYICSSCGRGFRRQDSLKGHKCCLKPKDNRGLRIIRLPAPRHNRIVTKVGDSKDCSQMLRTLRNFNSSNSKEPSSDRAFMDKQTDALIVKQEDSESNLTQGEAKVIFLGSSEVQVVQTDPQLLQGELLLEPPGTPGTTNGQLAQTSGAQVTSSGSSGQLINMQPLAHTSGAVVIRAPGTSLLKKNNILDSLKNNSLDSENVNDMPSFSLGYLLNQEDIQIMEIKTVVVDESDSQEVHAGGSAAVPCSQISTEMTCSSQHEDSPVQYNSSCTSSAGGQVAGPLQTLIEAATAVANSQQDNNQ